MVEDPYFPAAVLDNLLFLHMVGGIGDALAPDAEHVREKIVCQSKLVGVHTVGGHQQPTGEPGFGFVEAIADG